LGRLGFAKELCRDDDRMYASAVGWLAPAATPARAAAVKLESSLILNLQDRVAVQATGCDTRASRGGLEMEFVQLVMLC